MFSGLFGKKTIVANKASVQATYQKTPVYLGEDIQGTLTIQCTEPIVIGYVVLEIIGAGACRWTHQIGGGEDAKLEHYSQTNEYLRTAPQVIVEARPNGGLAISETATFNFLTKLPYGNFPSSDSCKIDMYHPKSHSSARYYCKFSVFDMSNALICDGDIDFAAVAHHNYERVEYPRLYACSFRFYGCLCFTPTIRANVYVIADKSVYYPGDVITLTYWIDCQGDFSKSVCAEFLRCTHTTSNANCKTGRSFNHTATNKKHMSPQIIAKVPFKPRSMRQTVTIIIPVDVTPTFSHVRECSSSWSYEVRLSKIGSIHGRDWFVPILINSRPSATPMIYPPKRLPETTVKGQIKYAAEEMPQVATNAIASYPVGVPDTVGVSPGQAPYPQGVMMVPTNSATLTASAPPGAYPQGVMMVPTNSATLTASAPPGVYVPVSTDEIQR